MVLQGEDEVPQHVLALLERSLSTDELPQVASGGTGGAADYLSPRVDRIELGITPELVNLPQEPLPEVELKEKVSLHLNAAFFVIDDIPAYPGLGFSFFSLSLTHILVTWGSYACSPLIFLDDIAGPA